MKEIALACGRVALVDDQDADLVAGYPWKARKAPQSRENYYAVAFCRGTALGMHRLIMGAPRGVLVDHINGNGLDNRRSNLRLCTHSQNNANLTIGARSKYGFIGVSYDANKWRKKWQGYVSCQNRIYRCGWHATAEEAARARDKLALELFGEFARLNFPMTQSESSNVR